MRPERPTSFCGSDRVRGADCRGTFRSALAISPRAFTLLEVIIVVILLALLAAITLPRLVGNEGREFQLAADRVSDLLAVYAQRHSLGQKIIALTHDPEQARLQLMELDRDDLRPEAPPEWRRDRFAPPVTLPLDAAVIEAKVDGDVLSEPAWWIIAAPGQERPMIELTIQSSRRSVAVVLPANGVAAQQFGAEVTDGASILRTSIDLDSLGRGREDW